MKNARLILFTVAYIAGLLGLAVAGYIYADYKIETVRHVNDTNKKFETDVAYLDLPQFAMTIHSGDNGASHNVRINICLEVEKRYASQLEDYSPRINDRIVNYIQNLDDRELTAPRASAHLRPRLLEIARAASNGTPIINVIFRQFLVV